MAEKKTETKQEGDPEEPAEVPLENRSLPISLYEAIKTRQYAENTAVRWTRCMIVARVAGTAAAVGPHHYELLQRAAKNTEQLAQSTQQTVHSTQQTAHSTQQTARSTQHAAHSMQHAAQRRQRRRRTAAEQVAGANCPAS